MIHTIHVILKTKHIDENDQSHVLAYGQPLELLRKMRRIPDSAEIIILELFGVLRECVISDDRQTVRKSNKYLIALS